MRLTSIPTRLKKKNRVVKKTITIKNTLVSIGQYLYIAARPGIFWQARFRMIDNVNQARKNFNLIGCFGKNSHVSKHSGIF